MRLTQDVPIKDTVRIGNGSNRTMFVSLPHRKKKGMVFRNISNLKGEKNEDGKKFFVNDQLPEVLKEKRRRVKQMK